MGTKLTSNFWLHEFTDSDTATRQNIQNVPTNEVLENLVQVAQKMETIRSILGDHRIHITSGFRCLKLNSLIGGSSSSAHVKGLAVDFVCPDFGTPKQICLELLNHQVELGWDQLIHEGKWVHIGWRAGGNRGQVLTADFTKRPTAYPQGIL